MSNKWDINWQIVRVNAKQIKDYDTKFHYVIDWFKEHPSENNYGIIKNWIKMTCMGYKKSPTTWIEIIDKVKILSFPFIVDNFEHQATEDLLKVFKDLSKRKYNFQFKGRTPKGHNIFMELLEEELDYREEFEPLP